MILIIFLLISTAAFGQVHFTGTGKMIIASGGKLIVHNPQPSGITFGAGSGILTSSEDAQVILHVGSSTGVFTVPFITPNGATIPFSYDIQTPGAGSGTLILSSWAVDESGLTNTVTGGPGLPASVSSFYTQNQWSNWVVQGGPAVVNRFWSIDPVGYTTKPLGEYIFTYNVGEIPSQATESQLTAQRWNDIDETWLDWLYADVANTTNKTVSVIISNPQDQFPIWVLTDIADPLPIQLARFTAECLDDGIELAWTTFSEVENAEFILERSADASAWSEVGRLPGAGTTSMPTYYRFIDDSNLTGTVYYRLIDRSITGELNINNAIAVTCYGAASSYLAPNPTTGDILVSGSTVTRVIDSAGRLVPFARTTRGIDISSLAAGIYTVALESGEHVKVIKH